MGRNRLARPARQAGEQAEGQVGRRHHLVEPELQDKGQPLPAMRRVRRQRRPATLGKVTIGLRKAIGRLHRAIDQTAPLLVPFAVQRLQALGTDLPRLLQHRHRQIGIHLFPQLRHRLVETQYVVQQKSIIVDRRGIALHGGSSSIARILHQTYVTVNFHAPVSPPQKAGSRPTTKGARKRVPVCKRPEAPGNSSPARGGGPRSGGGVSPYREADTPPSGLRPSTSPYRGG